jgi:hypothetical protein
MIRNYVLVGALVSLCVGYTSPGVGQGNRSQLQPSNIQGCYSETQKDKNGKLPLCKGLQGVAHSCDPPFFCNNGKCCGQYATDDRCKNPGNPCANH